MSIVGTLLRSLGHTPSGGSAPAAPSITGLVDNADGTVTVTIDGAAGVTNRVYYGASGESLTLGGSRSGDGAVTVTPALADVTYNFCAVSVSGSYYSLPSALHTLLVTSGDEETDQIKSAVEWLGAQRKAHAAKGIVYVRGANRLSLRVTIGMTAFRQSDENGVLMLTRSRDYFIEAVDLVLAGSAVVPARGDTIEETEGATTYIHEVLAPGGEPCWRWSGPDRTTYRVHTKEIDTEAA